MEILATIPVYTYPGFVSFFFAAGIIAIIVGLSCIISTTKSDSWVSLILGIIFLVVGAMGIIHSNNEMEKTATLDYNQYKVTIDETLGARELLDKYEILSREGEIFTIKEIEVDE